MNRLGLYLLKDVRLEAGSNTQPVVELGEFRAVGVFQKFGAESKISGKFKLLSGAGMWHERNS